MSEKKKLQASAGPDYGDRPIDRFIASVPLPVFTSPAMNTASPTANQRTPNPFPEGSPNENWRRGYEGVRHFGAPDSEAAKHWKMGRAARRADDAAPVGQGSAKADYSQCCDTPNMCSGARCCTLHDRPWSSQARACDCMGQCPTCRANWDHDGETLDQQIAAVMAAPDDRLDDHLRAIGLDPGECEKAGSRALKGAIAKLSGQGSATSGEAAPDLAETLTACAGILDTVKMEWAAQNSWSEYDQGVRNSVSACLAALAASAEQPTSPALCAVVTRNGVQLDEPPAVAMQGDIFRLEVSAEQSISTGDARPVAWAVTAPGGGIHKLAIKRDSAERKMAKWREEWPNNNCQVRPLIFGDAGTVPTKPGTPAMCSCGHPEQRGITHRTERGCYRNLVRYDACRCVLSQYCDGRCNPIYEDDLQGGADPRAGNNA